MANIRTEVCGKEVILLSGACLYGDPEADPAEHCRRCSCIEAPDKLIEAAQRNPDAVAFGYMAGRWVAAA